MENKHYESIKKPHKQNLRKISDIIASESRKSYSVVPMRAVKQKSALTETIEHTEKLSTSDLNNGFCSFF